METARLITRKEIEAIMKRGDAKTLKDILRSFQLSGKNDKVVGLLPHEREVLVEFLSIAAMQAHENDLNKEIAWSIINYVSIVIDLFPFFHKLAYIHEDNDLSIVSGLVICAINENLPSDEVFGEIETMSRFELFATINYIARSGRVKCLDARFTQPIVRRLYGAEFVQGDLLFALMATYLDKPIQIAERILTDIAQQIMR